ncbi:hypothetical protein LX36DRAFT_385690 [Colletotrichum falcatum]|nr:hypothetical protein LX36DRAFT_385690 [Colletotrichum falcatum]
MDCSKKRRREERKKEEKKKRRKKEKKKKRSRKNPWHVDRLLRWTSCNRVLTRRDIGYGDFPDGHVFLRSIIGDRDRERLRVVDIERRQCPGRRSFHRPRVGAGLLPAGPWGFRHRGVIPYQRLGAGWWLDGLVMGEGGGKRSRARCASAARAIDTLSGVLSRAIPKKP